MNPMKSGVSVVMSVCNGGRRLRQSVESILNQQDLEFEFVIVNDGSTDDTPEILEDYAAREERLRVIHQGNEGLTLSLIRGCRQARGQYIARQDADDISMPGRLKRLAARLDSDGKLAFASSWAEIIAPEGEVFAQITRPADPERATHQLLNERVGPPAHGTVMFRREAYEKVGGYRPGFYYGQDSDLWLRLAQVGLIAYEQAYLYRFCYSPASISAAQRDLQKEFGRIGRACLDARRKGESEAELLGEASRLRERIRLSGNERPGGRRRLAAGHYFIGSGLRARGDRRAAKYFRQAIRAYPLHWRAWLRFVTSLLTTAGGAGRSCTPDSGRTSRTPVGPGSRHKR